MSGRWTVGYLSDNFDQCKHFLAVFDILMNVGVYFIFIYIILGCQVLEFRTAMTLIEAS